jgi:hypothetical protein
MICVDVEHFDVVDWNKGFLGQENRLPRKNELTAMGIPIDCNSKGPLLRSMGLDMGLIDIARSPQNDWTQSDRL